MTGKAVLDLGCGWGGKAVYFAQHCQVAPMEGFDLPGVFVPEVPLEFARGLGVTGAASARATPRPSPTATASST